MSLAAWMKEFRALHERAKDATLSPEQWEDYRARRAELAQTILMAQRLTLRPGETPRKALRVARALQVDLKWSAGATRALTVDIGLGGIGVLLEKELSRGEAVAYTLRLSDTLTISGKARVVDVRTSPNHARVSLQFESLQDADRDQLELVVLDTVLGQLTV